jgi:dihydroflavonol-4-reductase
MKIKTLLTGATGFVGASVLRSLVRAGHDVRALVRDHSDRRNLSGFECEVFIGDLADLDSLRKAVKGCSAVFHVAADYRLWVPDPEKMKRTNVDGALALIQAATAAGVSRVIYTSTVGTLRLSPDGSPVDETSRADLSDMIGAYKQTKFLAEQALMELAARGDAPIIFVQPSAPVGPGDVKPTPTGRLIVDAARGRMPAYVDTGLNIVHVNDVAAGHLLAYEKGAVGESYILGGENRPLHWILGTIADLTGKSAPRIRLPHWLVLPLAHVCEGVAHLVHTGEPRITVDGVRMARKRMYFSSEKARRELGYASRPAAEALRDAIDWFSEHGYLKQRRVSSRKKRNFAA